MSANGISVEFAVAVARNGVIGRDGGLPWRMPSDLKHFRKLTMGKPVLMGRKTFAAIGKPLDGRDNIVITRDETFSAEGVHVVRSVEEALGLARRLATACGADAVMVIGGADIYRQMLDAADVIHISEIDLEPQGDAFFPPLDPAIWRETSRVLFERGERDDAAFTAITYERR